MPAAAPGNMKRTVGPTIARAIWPVSAPAPCGCRSPATARHGKGRHSEHAGGSERQRDERDDHEQCGLEACFDQDNCALASMVLDVEQREVRVGAYFASARCGTQGERFAGTSRARASSSSDQLNCAYTVKKSGWMGFSLSG